MLSLTHEEVHKRLEEWLEVEFSFLKIESLVDVITQLHVEQQHFLLEMIRRVASIQINLAYQFALNAIGHLDSLDRATIEAWALHAMDSYDRGGLREAMDVISDVERFIVQRREREVGALYEESARVLLPFLHGLSGRRLKLDAADCAFSDSETIYLPHLVALFDNRESNFQLYKAMAVHQWALGRYGTFRIDPAQAFADYAERKWAQTIFHHLETLRLDALIARELPGLFRQMEALQQQRDAAPLPSAWQAAQKILMKPGASVDDSLVWLKKLYSSELPAPRCYQGSIDWALVVAMRDQRMARERAVFRMMLGEAALQQPREAASEARFTVRPQGEKEAHESLLVELHLDGKPMPIPETAKGVVTSIVQDLGMIPPDYLVAAGPGEYDPTLFAEQQIDPDAVWQGTYHEEGAFLYDEWDYRSQHYRKGWCAVREKTLPPNDDDGFVATALQHHGRLVRQLRRSFEAMRDEDRLLKKQSSGDGVDIDALIEALADQHQGRELPEQLFTRMHRVERNIAVLFMVDMSGSTRGWINDAERESLLLLCEALETLGDRYAIYGFSGMTRKRCEIYLIKEFDESYGTEIQQRISAIRPQDYTRMGFAIRHLTRKLLEVNARTRLLITLSDGKPDDYNDYRGEYGIEDTRRALIEARRAGIHPYCITIDEQARDYLPRMYGPAAFTVVSEVRDLPFKVSDIYRRITR